MPYNNLSTDERKEALKILYSNAVAGIAVSVLVSVALVFAFDISDENINHDKIVWFGIIMSVLTLRTIDVGLFLKTKKSNKPYNTNYYLSRFSVGCVLTAMSWCGYALWFHSTSSIIEVTTTIAILSALAGGSANILSGSRFTAVSLAAKCHVQLGCVTWLLNI